MEKRDARKHAVLMGSNEWKETSMRISLKPVSAATDSTAAAVLYGNTCLMNFGFALLIPLLAIHFTKQLGFAAASVGLVLAVRQFTQQGLDLVGGVFADRFGARTSIAIGCFVRAAGFIGVGEARTLPPLLLWAAVSGLGGAFFDASGTAALADVVAPEKRQRAFAASATLGNVGQTLGPLAGVALLNISFVVVSLVAAGCFVLIGVLTLLLLPGDLLLRTRLEDAASARRTSGHGSGIIGPVRALLTDRTFVWLTILLAGFWFLWAQINITVPLAAVQLGGPERGAQLAALAFAINAGPAILLQYPLTSFIGTRYPAQLVLAICVAVCGLGMALVFAAPVLLFFVAGVALFALARMLIWPTVNVVTADLAPTGMLGAYFGFGALAVAVGAGTGQFAGGFLYDAARSHGQAAFLWAPFLVIGLVAAYGLIRLRLTGRDSLERSEASQVRGIGRSAADGSGPR